MALKFKRLLVSIGLLSLLCGNVYAVDQNKSQEFPFLKNNGGLNTQSSNFSVADNETPDSQNVYFSTSGSIQKRKGQAKLISTACNSGAKVTLIDTYIQSDGTDFLMVACGDKLYNSTSISSVSLSDITGGLTITADHLFHSVNVLNTWLATNNEDVPIKWSGSSNASAADVPTNLTKAKYVAAFKNRGFYANVKVGATTHASRLYYSKNKDLTSWTSTHYIDINKDDGEEITGMVAYGDRLVLFKETNIYLILFTGDSDIPFIQQDTQADVGCVSGYTIKNVEGYLVFLSQDGMYTFDGNYTAEISDKVKTIFIEDLATSRFKYAIATTYDKLNHCWLAVTTSGQTENNRVLAFDSKNNAYSRYVGINASYLATVYVDGDERLYSGDQNGWLYRQDTTYDDVGTAINAYYYTKWFDFGKPLCSKKLHDASIYLEDVGSYNLNVGYNYDFRDGVWKSANINMSQGGAIVGTAIVGTAVVGGSGGVLGKINVLGSGRLFRFKFSNSGTNQTFNIRGYSVNVELQKCRWKN